MPPPNRGGLNSTHIHGTHVPVEEPSTASIADMHPSLTMLREKLIKIGAKVVRHGCYVIFQMAEVAVPRELFRGNSAADRAVVSQMPNKDAICRELRHPVLADWSVRGGGGRGPLRGAGRHRRMGNDRADRHHSSACDGRGFCRACGRFCHAWSCSKRSPC